MTLKSMTGFARADGGCGAMSWSIEARSVNGRNLDVRFRGPSGLEGLDAQVRQLAAKRFQRGNLQISLSVRRGESVQQVRLNEQALRDAAAAVARARAIVNGEPPRLDMLLAIKGVLEIVDTAETPGEAAKRAAALTESLERVLEELDKARAAEGARLEPVLAAQVDRIETLAGEAERSPGRSAEAQRARLKEQVGRLIADFAMLDENRLYQEAAILAARIDIEEEIKRLKSHVAAARLLLAREGAVGRELDFLAQELNREANTLCSKANGQELTRIGLALKVVIDQFKEQVQNIE
jgi:uncharacterized protein (TIGR00255 family)